MTLLEFLTPLGTSIVTAGVLFAFLWLLSRSSDSRQYPPGPKPKPVIGNLTDLPSGGHEWLGYVELGRKYASDVLYFTALGTPLLVINSFDVARELLDKKGALYSDRPRLVMIKELMAWDWNLVLMSYGKLFSAHRRVVQQESQPSVVAREHHPVMGREVLALLHRLLSTPENIVPDLRQMAGSIIMTVTYGHRVTSTNDQYVAIAEAVRDHAEARPGVELVDVFPILKYLPAWFPGASFQKQAATGRELSIRMRTIPFEGVKNKLAEGTEVPCMATRLLSEDLEVEGIERDEFIKNCCGVVYSAGADTTVAALRNFALAMMLYPDVQCRGQEELDRIIGRDHLPTFEDRARLPYVSHTAKEALRWKAVSSLGVPHATLDSDEFRGAHVPKHTTVLANLHAMLHDEAVYTRADVFDPDRFAPTPEKPTGEPDPARAAFGFGRRICPGRFFAEDSIFLTVASLLHVFTFALPDDPTAAAAVRNVRWSSGLVSHPSPFLVKLTPRFDGARELVCAAQL
ncbi:cytochrome P450 [Trametes elegans]|nr:cytochrome P450 [Trametes elegans]